MTKILPDQHLLQGRLTTSEASISYLREAILSLDGFPIGHVVDELNGKIIIDNSNGDQFALPDCRIISSDTSGMTKGFVVDIEYCEISHYRTIKSQSHIMHFSYQSPNRDFDIKYLKCHRKVRI